MATRHAHPWLQTERATTSGTVTAATSSTVVLGNNPSRVEVTIENIGANPVDLAFATTQTAGGNGPPAPTAPTAVAGQGLRLAAGASWTSKAYSGPIAAIATTAPSALVIAEF